MTRQIFAKMSGDCKR